jgi:ferritin-like metal-binding protein YciE
MQFKITKTTEAHGFSSDRSYYGKEAGIDTAISGWFAPEAKTSLRTRNSNLTGSQKDSPTGDMPMAEKTLKDVFIDELRDLYNAEQQLIKAIPKMAKAATSEDLRKGFEEHLEQTKGHASRIEQIFQELGEPVKGKKCKGMEGIISEGGEVMSEDYQGAVMDAAIITAAQRVEHYEIAAYGSVHAFAILMGETEAAGLLEQTLEEEKETDEKLSELSEQINAQAFEAESSEPKVRGRAAKAGSLR